jgi:hypothetical protein
LIIFAKEPTKNTVKTRLRDYLSEAQRLNLYKAFLRDTINLAKRIHCDMRVLAYDSGNKNPQYLNRIARQFTFYKQQGNDLGQRMHNAFKFAKANKFSKTVIIGSDSPDLPEGFIEAAFRKLDETDVVLGPSLDGGYYLVGMKSLCLVIFKGIKWSSDKVLAATVDRLKRFNKDVTVLNKWCDVDDPKSLAHLKRNLKNQKDKNIAKWTRRYLKI